LRGKRGMACLGELVIFARRAAARFLEVGLDQAVDLHAPHQGIDRAFTHADVLRQPARDVVGVAVPARQQGEHAHVEHAFAQLDQQRFRHCVTCIAWYLA
jgi:hypothetical protein